MREEKWSLLLSVLALPVRCPVTHWASDQTDELRNTQQQKAMRVNKVRSRIGKREQEASEESEASTGEETQERQDTSRGRSGGKS